MTHPTVPSLPTALLSHEDQRFELWWAWSIVLPVGHVPSRAALAGEARALAVSLGASFYVPRRVMTRVVKGHPGVLRMRFRELFVNREIALTNVERADAVTYRPVRDCGGWGLCHGVPWRWRRSSAKQFREPFHVWL